MPWLRTRATDPRPAAPLITLLTDYGAGSVYVGQLHAVIARICPAAQVIDLAHDVAPGDVVAGALALADALPYVPVGWHVAVVDPEVGTTRHALALLCHDGRVLIGPDNGLLSVAVRAAGGVRSAVEITRSPMALDPISPTFHGRDLFAPVAAALAGGQSLISAGTVRELPDDLVELDLPLAQITGDGLDVVITAVDAFGNLALLAGADDVATVGLEPDDVVAVTTAGRRRFARYGVRFADVGRGRLLLHEDSTGRLALAVNGASAAELLGVGAGAPVSLSRAS